MTLVLPGEADIAAGKVSVMTPIGIALIGLSAGRSMNWTARDGRIHKLTVVSVEPGQATTPPSSTAHASATVDDAARPRP